MNSDTESRLTVRAVSWPFVTMMLCMLVIASTSIVTLSAIRAYVAGSAAWTSAERDAAVALMAYIRVNQRHALIGLHEYTSIRAGDRTARLELLKPHPDYERARRGLLAGKNHPDDIPAMIWLFRMARWFDVGRRPLQVWAQADELFELYLPLEQRVVAARAQGETGTTAQINAWLEELRAIHTPIVGLENAFGNSIDAIARELTDLLLGFLVTSTLVLLVAGFAITRRVVRREDAMAALLRDSQRRIIAEQERSDALLRSIGDAVIATDRHGTVEFVNAAAEQLTGWSRAEASGRPLEDVFRLASASDDGQVPIRERIAALLSAGEVQRLTAHGAQLLRRDGSIAPIGERAAPLKNQQGEVVGMVLVLRDVTPERRLADQLRHLANHDALTGMPNRMHFEQQLATALQMPMAAGMPRFTTLFLDLDQFKVVNDSCGHHAGDDLIRRVAACIREQLDTDDLLARLGGDEFGLLLHARPPALAEQTAERVRQAVADLRFVWKGRTFIVHASIGLVHDDPTLKSTTDVLCAADRACYAAKEAGRNRVRVYHAIDADLDTWQGEMVWAARLNAALEKDEFMLLAREIRAVGAAHRLSGRRCFEVQLRLHDAPDHTIPSAAFALAAERFSLTSQIDRWVIAHVFAAQAQQHRLGQPLPLCMINLSAASLDDEHLVQFVAEQQREHGLPSGTVGFELTEVTALSKVTAAAAVIGELRRLGCLVALDDFGVRVSSYGHVRELPVDLLKIDASFIRNLARDAVAFALVEAMHKIARATGIHTVATGADDEATLSALSLMKIDFAQGDAIGAEMPLMQALQAGDEPLELQPRERRAGGDA